MGSRHQLRADARLLALARAGTRQPKGWEDAKKKKSICAPHIFQGYTGKSWKSASFLMPGTALCYQIASATQERDEFMLQVPEDGTPECTALCLALPAQ